MLQGCHGLGFVERFERLTQVTGHFEAYLCLLGSAQVSVDFPVFLRHESTDFALTLDHQLDRHGLHTTGRQAPGDLGPQQRRHHVAHDAVEEAARLLGVHPSDVQLTRLREGFLNRLLGDFVEHHALVAAVVAADGFTQVPGDGLPFAVQVGCEVDGVGILGQTTQLVDHLFLTRQDLVLGFPACFRVDAHAGHQLPARLLLRRQCRGLSRSFAALGTRLLGRTGRTAGGKVSDVADTRLHHVLVAQVLVDGLGLGRGFHNDQRFAHGSEYS